MLPAHAMPLSSNVGHCVGCSVGKLVGAGDVDGATVVGCGVGTLVGAGDTVGAAVVGASDAVGTAVVTVASDCISPGYRMQSA